MNKKIVVITVVIALLANSIFTDMREFTIELFKQIPNFAKWFVRMIIDDR
mgnify:CR=1 FL=1